MKALKDILQDVKVLSRSDEQDLNVGAICFDSRKVKDGDLFVATRGEQVDGHNFIEKALANGAKVVVVEDLPADQNSEILWIQVEDSKEALGLMASNFYDNPSRKLKLVGITGTNGKTTCTTLLHNLFVGLGYNTGLLSTIENKINEEVIPSTHTTPDAVQLNALLDRMVRQQCTHCFMEVSSHAVVQRRIAGLDFSGAVFTNISHDHLDYHKTFDEYIKAKKGFFDGMKKGSFALVNADDKRGLVMLQNCKAAHHTFSLKRMSDFKARVLTCLLYTSPSPRDA